MKQLKFMLAAATAIGLATAAQADGVKETKLIDNENFDTVENVEFARDMPGYSYSDPDNLADDESTISTAAEGYNETQSLKVNTGTNALLRAMVASGDTAIPITLTDEKSVYIDTMVQFTVTPAGDTVEAGEDDKLMIYLAETTNEVDDVVQYSTNLMVKAAMFMPGGDSDEGDTIIEKRDATDLALEKEDGTAPVVSAGSWYALKVTTALTNGVPVFNIFLDGAKLYASTPLYSGVADRSVFPSLLGTSDTTLTYVGFAGEGMVDNLTVATLEPQTTVDFTFTWTAARISAVTYTIGDGAVVKDQSVTSGTAIADLDPGATITIAVTPADWYALVDDAVLSYQVPDTTGQTQPLDDLVKKVANVTTDDAGKVTVEVTDGTKPADVYVDAGSFAAEGTTPAQLSKALNWALSKGGQTTAAAAGALVSGLDFADGEEETDAEKAYLLDCTEAELSGEDGEIAKFKFAGFDPATGTFKVGTEKQVGDKAAYGNGYVEVRGSATVGGAYDEAADKSKHSFFKAFLVPFQPAAVDAE